MKAITMGTFSAWSIDTVETDDAEKMAISDGLQTISLTTSLRYYSSMSILVILSLKTAIAMVYKYPKGNDYRLWQLLLWTYQLL